MRALPICLVLGLTGASVAQAAPVETAKLTVLHSFTGSDGARPLGGLAFGTDGSLFGTASEGGVSNRGTVFRLERDRTLTKLLDFDGHNGETPMGDLKADGNGLIYGTTLTTRIPSGSYGSGSIFRIDSNSTVTARWFVPDSTLLPPATNEVFYRGVTIDQGGYLSVNGIRSFFSNNYEGNWYYDSNMLGLGVFHGNSGLADGAPVGENYAAFNGNAGFGGRSAIMQMSSGWSWELDPATGTDVRSAPVLDSQGNLWVTTTAYGQFGKGAIYKLSNLSSGPWAASLDVVASFKDDYPAQRTLMIDRGGNIFGMLYGGGYAKGQLFRLSPDGQMTTIFTFGEKVSMGSNLIVDARGNFYGTSWDGGSHELGTVFRITNTGFVTGLATGVPEPSSWAMLIAGFGLVGAAMRLRHRSIGAY